MILLIILPNSIITSIIISILYSVVLHPDDITTNIVIGSITDELIKFVLIYELQIPLVENVLYFYSNYFDYYVGNACGYLLAGVVKFSYIWGQHIFVGVDSIFHPDSYPYMKAEAPPMPHLKDYENALYWYLAVEEHVVEHNRWYCFQKILKLRFSDSIAFKDFSFYYDYLPPYNPPEEPLIFDKDDISIISEELKISASKIKKRTFYCTDGIPKFYNSIRFNKIYDISPFKKIGLIPNITSLRVFYPDIYIYCNRVYSIYVFDDRIVLGGYNHLYQKYVIEKM